MDRPLEVHSLYEDCRAQAYRHKWIRSEQVGYDLGEQALHEWGREHWSKHLRSRWSEHIRGIRFWLELGQSDFGLLLREPFADDKLMNEVVRRLESCQENLDIILWAQDSAIGFDRIYDILVRLDINSKRLPYRIDPAA